MVDPNNLLNRLDEAPGGALTEDELEALLLWARDDMRQVEQIVEACGLDMGRLHDGGIRPPADADSARRQTGQVFKTM